VPNNLIDDKKFLQQNKQSHRDSRFHSLDLAQLGRSRLLDSLGEGVLIGKGYEQKGPETTTDTGQTSSRE
jgi:hypothetical protein